MPSISENRCRWAAETVIGVVAGLWPHTGGGSPPGQVPERTGTVRSETPWPEDLERVARALLYGLQVEEWRDSGMVVGTRE